jgi:hypothetical protein
MGDCERGPSNGSAAQPRAARDGLGLNDASSRGSSAAAAGWAAILGRTIERSNGDQVIVLDSTNVDCLEGHEGFGLARSCDKLDLEAIGFVNLDYRA